MLNTLLKIGTVILAADDIKTNLENQKLQRENPNAELKKSISARACETALRGAAILYMSAYNALR